MATYLGSFAKNTGMSTNSEVHVSVSNCELIVEVSDVLSDNTKHFKRGDAIVDPITDDELTIIACSKSGFYVEDYNGARRVLPLKETLLFNL